MSVERWTFMSVANLHYLFPTFKNDYSFQLIMYIEACESGSMFDNILEEDTDGKWVKVLQIVKFSQSYLAFWVLNTSLRTILQLYYKDYTIVSNYYTLVTDFGSFSSVQATSMQ